MIRTRALVLAILLSSAAWAGEPAKYTPPTHEAFNRTATYPYVASEERAAKIRAGTPALRRCMPETEIRELLGAPDFGHVSSLDTETGPVPYVQVWHYLLALTDSGFKHEGARVVVWLHLDGKLRAVSVYNMAGLSDIPGLHNEKCS